jgi:predicted LPLAT superfamily acyltransferase
MLTKFVQGQNAILQSDPDLEGSLRDLAKQNLTWPERSALMPFARQSLGVQPAYEDAWYKSACWGYYSALLLEIFTTAGFEDRLCDLLEPDSDWSPLEKALEEGKGAIILAAHLGPGRIPAFASNQRGHRVRQIVGYRRPNSKENQDDYIFVSSDAEMKSSLVKAIKHLKSGGVIAVAGTGRYGGQQLSANLLGNPLPVFLGTSELVQISGAPAFWMTGNWTSQHRLRLICEPIPRPIADGEEWHKQFLGRYLDLLGRHMKTYPADLGFRHGIWNGEKGLPWYQPQVSQPLNRF